MENYILRILVIHVIQTYRETPYKIEKLFDISLYHFLVRMRSHYSF
jgi:hypothetical protein